MKIKLMKAKNSHSFFKEKRTMFTLLVGLLLTVANCMTIIKAEEKNSDYPSEPAIQLDDDTIYNAFLTSNVDVADNIIVLSKTIEQSQAEFCSEMIYLVPKDGLSAEELISRSSGGNNYIYDFDSTFSVKAFSTVYYTKDTSVVPNKIKLSKVTGGYEIQDMNTVVDSATLVMGCIGVGQLVNQRAEFYPTSNSWTYYAPSNWVGVAPDVAGGIGASYNLTLRRSYNTTTWRFSLVNHVEEYWSL